jgi:hypothetical protein
MIDAKLKGEGIDLDAETAAVPASNVIDLMAALKKSLGQSPPDTAAPPKRKKAADVRQTGLKLPIKGGRDGGKVAPQTASKPSRKRA